MIENTWNAALYDARHSFVTVAGEALIDLLDPQPGERIIDLGCGTGHHVRQLADRGAHAIGIDGAADMIAAARQAYPDLDFRVADGAAFTVEAPVGQPAVFFRPDSRFADLFRGTRAI